MDRIKTCDYFLAFIEDTHKRISEYLEFFKNVNSLVEEQNSNLFSIKRAILILEKLLQKVVHLTEICRIENFEIGNLGELLCVETINKRHNSQRDFQYEKERKIFIFENKIIIYKIQGNKYFDISYHLRHSIEVTEFISYLKNINLTELNFF